MTRPAPGTFEERAQPVEVDGRRIRGLIPYGVESRDMGGWREVIEPTALRNASLEDLIVTHEHRGVPLGRYPRTLELEDRADGLVWSVEPPHSRQDIVEAVERGDLRSASWRMLVARDEWRGEVRHVTEIAELRDVAITAAPAYPSATVELRSRPEEATVPEQTTAPEAPERTQEPTEPRSEPDPPEEPTRPSAGSLRVEGRSAGERPRSLAEVFRSRGFPTERATIEWEEFESRAVTWTPPIGELNQISRAGVPLPMDQRYVWPAFPRVGVDSGVTSVLVVRQTERELAAPDDVIRPLATTTPKPETSSTLDVVTVDLQQVATRQSGIPNIYLRQRAIDTIISTDLRLAINEGLDKLVLDALAIVTQQVAPDSGEPIFTAVRRAITLLEGEGFSPDLLVLTPGADEELDLVKVTEGDNLYMWAPDRAPSIYGLRRRVSKSAPNPIVVDSGAFGKLYASSVSLQRFEENDGATNSSTVRMETTAVFGIERGGAAVQITEAS